MKRELFIILIAAVPSLLQPATALELFGVDLETTRRDQLRIAAKEAGLQLIREGGDGNWFDVYNSAAVVPGSRRFYLGFVKQDQRFAFAEYEFNGLHSQLLMRSLAVKYGDPDKLGGNYLSDRGYRWQRDGFIIEINTDWQNYKTRLSYVHPENMTKLRAEQTQLATPPGDRISFY